MTKSLNVRFASKVKRDAGIFLFFFYFSSKISTEDLTGPWFL